MMEVLHAVVGFPRALQKAINFIESLNDDRNSSSNILAGVDSELRQDVLQILRRWGTHPRSSLRQIVSKKSLKHEIEECLPALQHLNEWCRTQPVGSRFVAVDVCGGKGIFSLLLKELVLSDSQSSCAWRRLSIGSTSGGGGGGAILERIILIELAENIDWTHLQGVEEDNVIPIEIWRQCNVNDIDAMVEQLSGIITNAPVGPSSSSSTLSLALTGIHLCGSLSPSFLSIVNGLGSTNCPCFCLVPCCMPKEVLCNKNNNLHHNKVGYNGGGEDNVNDYTGPTTTITTTIKPAVIPVFRYEDPSARIIRRDNERRRIIAKKKLCIETPDGGKSYACWGCGRFGHQKNVCPDPFLPSSQRVNRPTIGLDVSQVLHQPAPCAAYCELLLSSIDGHWSNRRLWETGIISHESSKQLDSNWNRNRKSIYIVVSSSSSSSSTVADDVAISPQAAAITVDVA